MDNRPLITKYRPTTFDQCVGNEIIIKALKEAVNSNSSRPHAYLFTGSSGIGKTTLARIVANEVKASVMDFDAASKSGVDDTRQLTQFATFRPLQLEPDKPNLMIIVDEAHNLSDKAHESLLKFIEEPPDFLYIAYCTTEPKKIKKTIETRCYPVALKSLKMHDIEDLISAISEMEGWAVKDDVFQGIVQAANGSARMALSVLQLAHNLNSRDELAQAVASVEAENNPAIKLAQYLLKGGRDWRAVCSLINEIEDHEEAIIALTRYFSGSMVKSQEDQARGIWFMIDSLTRQESWDKKVQLMYGIGGIMWRDTRIPF